LASKTPACPGRFQTSIFLNYCKEAHVHFDFTLYYYKIFCIFFVVRKILKPKTLKYLMPISLSLNEGAQNYLLGDEADEHYSTHPVATN
jgi:hypothetical protein